MFPSKSKKIVFLILIAILAGGSMVGYAQSEANIVVKTVELILFQQFAAIALYLLCFSRELLKMR